MQLRVMKDVLRAMRTPIFECEGWEADDVIGTVGRICGNNGWECVIVTGDLGELGHAIVRDFFSRDGVDLGENFQDCGLLLYDRQAQDMHAGASGCGCSASVLNGYLLTEMRRGRWKRILFAPTGALLSPTSSFQGESIPGICHVVCISTEK